MGQARIAVVYYSSTGHVHQLAQAVLAGAQAGGAEVRLRRARELAPPEAIAENPSWEQHLAATRDVPEAAGEDLEWANGYAFGTPARYGQPAAQLKQFIDGLAPLWKAGKLLDKVATTFTSSQNVHGGQEATLLNLATTFFHWGSLILPPDTTQEVAVQAGGNPYGTSHTTGTDPGPVPDVVLRAARAQGERLAHFTARLA